MPYRRYRRTDLRRYWVHARGTLTATNVTPTRTAAQAVTMKLDALVSRSLA